MQTKFHHLYNSHSWRKRRAHQLKLVPLCEACAERGLATPGTVADHVDRHHGDPIRFRFGKLQTLCFACHDGRKRKFERNGYSDEVGPDGYPIDPSHPFNRPRGKPGGRVPRAMVSRQKRAAGGTGRIFESPRP